VTWRLATQTLRQLSTAKHHCEMAAKQWHLHLGSAADRLLEVRRVVVDEHKHWWGLRRMRLGDGGGHNFRPLARRVCRLNDLLQCMCEGKVNGRQTNGRSLSDGQTAGSWAAGGGERIAFACVPVILSKMRPKEADTAKASL